MEWKPSFGQYSATATGCFLRLSWRRHDVIIINHYYYRVIISERRSRVSRVPFGILSRNV